MFASELLKVYAVSPVRKVFAKDKPAAWGMVTSKDKIELSLVRNETEPFFLVLRPAAELQNVTISFAWAPQPADSGPARAAPTWSYRRVAEVPVKGISKWYGMLGAETGTIPDPLLSHDAFTAPAELNSVLLVSAETGFDVAAGRVVGSIRVHANGKRVASIPVELEVWDIALPARPALQTLTHNLEEKSRTSWKFLQEAGFTALKYGPQAPAVRLDENGELQIDFTEYKAGLDIVFGELGYDYVLVPPSLLGSISQLSKSYLGLGITVGSERFWPIFDQYMKRMGDFYRAHGWKDKVIFYMFDEINEEHHALVIELARRAKLQYPEVMVMITTHVMSDALAAALDAWCVPWHFFATEVEHIPNWQKWQREGLELWAYMNSLYTLNAQASLGANRFYPSVLAKYGYKGNFWWGIAYNAGKDPWTELHRHGNQKQGMYGNGLLFYPPHQKEMPGFQPWHASLRWESYRQGLDEYALLAQLGDAIAQTRRSLGEPASAEIFSKARVVHWWGSLLSREFRWHMYRPDREYIHRFRQLLVHEIQTIRQQPPGIVAVEYAAGPSISSATVGIRGVCPAGTLVTVAGQRIIDVGGSDVRHSKVQGTAELKPFVFRAEVPLQVGRNLIPIVLDDGRGKVKTFYREIDYQVPPAAAD
ncbi:MAG: glycoside hydrolase domain-containing protein [Planctomycetota bacterium]|nr:glycoside hydrolase domain-containing protein [Planctomycetota bacterium]